MGLVHASSPPGLTQPVGALPTPESMHLSRLRLSSHSYVPSHPKVSPGLYSIGPPFPILALELELFNQWAMTVYTSRCTETENPAWCLHPPGFQPSPVGTSVGSVFSLCASR